MLNRTQTLLSLNNMNINNKFCENVKWLGYFEELF